MPQHAFANPSNLAACAALDHIGCAVLLIDAETQVTFANREAHEIAGRLDALALEDGHLRFLKSDVHAEFECYLKRGDRTGTFATSLPRRSGEHPYALLVKPLEGTQATYGCYIYDFDAQREVDHALLQRVYGLTSTEAQVTMHLFQGMNVERVARTLAVRESTVRTHVTKVLSKCHVRSIAALLQHLALGPRARLSE